MSEHRKGNQQRPGKVVLESGLEVKTVYDASDVEASGGLGAVGQPGAFPFTRGIHPQMYRKRPWTMRQYSGFGSAEDTNARFKYLIREGNTGLNVAFDLPTQCGYDSDDERSLGEVGRVGMAVDSLLDMETAFRDIDLDRITVSLTINGAAVPIIAMYLALARKRGFAWHDLRGTAQNDILKEFIGRGTWIFPVDASVKLVGDSILFCAERCPRYSPVSICGYHIRETGADPVQEMAYAFNIAKAYADHVIGRGLAIDDFASRLSFNFDIFGNLFEQVAKFRAGRRLWARIISEDYGAADPKSAWMRMIAGGGGGGLTIDQPINNVARGAYYALISALSGTQTMALCSYDEAYTIPSEEAARISLRTMQILIEEMGLCDTVDPLGGSWYVETLTNQLEERMRACMAGTDERGGIVKLVAEGQIQAELARQAYENQRKLESGELRKVGVNCYRSEEEQREVALHPYDAAAAAAQQERLARLREQRDNDEVRRCLSELRQVAGRGDNVMPTVIEAVSALATVGEVTQALKDVHGTYQENVRF